MKVCTPRTTLTPTQQRILECVIKTIADRGYARTTIGEISQRLEISKGVIQYHFPSKEDLIQETVAYIYTVARNYMSAQIWQTTDEWAQIRSFIELSGQFYQQYPIHIQALQAIRADFQPRNHNSLAITLYERELTDLANIFTVGQQKGVFRQFDPDVAALTLRMALNGIVVKLKNQQSYDITIYTHELIDFFHRALCEN